MKSKDIKRLFFGMSVDAPWPDLFPGGREVSHTGRHITLAFLGNILFEPLQKLLPDLPILPFLLGPVGVCDKVLFLPSSRPRCVAYHVNWLQENQLSDYHNALTNFLRQHNYALQERSFLPHVTLARAPFNEHLWRQSFQKLPLRCLALQLYESKGNLTYESIWSQPLIPAFEEFEHTADAAFIVRGTNLKSLLINARASLAYRFPPILNYTIQENLLQSLDDIICVLNAEIAQADLSEGCPYKAVSWHGQIDQRPDGLLEWEMIVDV